MKPRVTAEDIPLLERNAELPSPEAILARFTTFFEVAGGNERAQRVAAAPPDLPEFPEALDGSEEPSVEEEVIAELNEAQDAPPAEALSGDELEAPGDASSSPASGDDEVDPPEAQSEEEGDTHDTVLELSPLSDEEIAEAQESTDQPAGTLTMAGLSDEAIAHAREQADVEPPEEDAQEAATVISEALSDADIAAAQATETQEAAPPKRRGRKSRKAKKKT